MKCPYCAEEIQDDAKKCRYCGEWLEPAKAPTTNQVNPKSVNKALQPRYKTWWGILIIILLCLAVIQSISSRYSQKKSETTESSSSSNLEEESKQKVQTESQKHEIFYEKVMYTLSDFFSMKKSTPVDSQDRYFGETHTGVAFLGIIGNKQNISQATLIIGLPKDNPYDTQTNLAILSIFLKNVVPEWKNSSDWINQIIKNFTNSSSYQKKVYGNKRIEISLEKSVRMMTVTVSSNSLKLKSYTDNSEKKNQEIETEPNNKHNQAIAELNAEISSIPREEFGGQGEYCYPVHTSWGEGYFRWTKGFIKTHNRGEALLDVRTWCQNNYEPNSFDFYMCKAGANMAIRNELKANKCYRVLKKLTTWE